MFSTGVIPQPAEQVVPDKFLGRIPMRQGTNPAPEPTGVRTLDLMFGIAPKTTTATQGQAQPQQAQPQQAQPMPMQFESSRPTTPEVGIPYMPPMAQMPQNQGTTSLDVPPALASLLGMSTPPTQAQPMVGMQPPGFSGIGSSVNTNQTAIPSYAVGGQIGMGGMPTNPQPGQMPMGQPSAGPGLAAPGVAQRPISAEQIDGEAQKFVQAHPDKVQEIQQAIQQAMQSGELSQQQLTMMVQMATVALQNPDMYPQLRKMAIQQGLATEQDLSEQYDQGLLFVLVVVGKTIQGGGQPQGPIPSMKGGGPVPKVPENQPVVIKAHEGEYVIPKHVVQAKGTEFFDKLLENYKQGG
jgi:hypothetical protein